MILPEYNKRLKNELSNIDEVELYFNSMKYLQNNDVWKDEYSYLLIRYVKIQTKFMELFKNEPKHYMCDKYANALANLEEQLLLTPKSLLQYKKDKTLTIAKQAKIRSQIQKDK